MDQQHHKPEEDETPGWLENLQQESWQAEILISGGAFIGIVGLFGTLDSISSVLTYSTKLNPIFFNFLFAGFVFIILSLAEGFLLHLILRGYWIGLIGLNYVFPNGINQEKLALRGKFSSFFKSSSNTTYLIKLDKHCSLVFAFTFFLIFSFAGLIIFLSLSGAIQIIFEPLVPYIEGLPKFIGRIFLFAGAIFLIDFFTFGRIKRIKWFSKVYFPLHYILSRITLSFLYRRLYYTIISNIKPKYIILGLSIQIFSVALLVISESSLPNDISPTNSFGEGAFLSFKEESITEKTLHFSITHIPSLEDEIFANWKKEKKDTTTESFEKIEAKERLRLITNVYEIYVDTTRVRNLQWIIRKETVLGFNISKLNSLINLSHFDNGSHQLAVRIRSKNKYILAKSDPELNYYAKAYFFIDR